MTVPATQRTAAIPMHAAAVRTDSPWPVFYGCEPEPPRIPAARVGPRLADFS